MTLPEIARQIESGMDCAKRHSCSLFTARLAHAAPEGAYKVHEGLIKFDNSFWFHHFWAESFAGERFDPTLKQFDFFNLNSATYESENSYSPREYLTEFATNSK